MLNLSYKNFLKFYAIIILYTHSYFLYSGLLDYPNFGAKYLSCYLIFNVIHYKYCITSLETKVDFNSQYSKGLLERITNTTNRILITYSYR